jgi:hypothetical protein
VRDIFGKTKTYKRLPSDQPLVRDVFGKTRTLKRLPSVSRLNIMGA